jgi:2-dehydropantoate 2-reductase
MGAGAVGCYYGGMLARAGHPVTLVGRPAHVEAMRRAGLRVQTAAFDEYVAVQASTSVDALAQAEVVLFCVKSADTEPAGRSLMPHLNADATVLSLQNGVDNAPRLAEVLGRAVVPAVVYVATEMAGPGHVRHHGRGELVIGPSSASARIAQSFGAADIPVSISDNVAGALWAKLIVNCAFNALSAVSQRPYGEIFAQAGIEAVMRDVVAECLAVARAGGIEVPGDMWQAVQRIAASMPDQQSSTAQDLARGKVTEIDYLNGYVARVGAAAGVATPANRVLHAMVKLLETRPLPLQ